MKTMEEIRNMMSELIHDYKFDTGKYEKGSHNSFEFAGDLLSLIIGEREEKCNKYPPNDHCESCENGYTINDDTSWDCVTKGIITHPITLRDLIERRREE